MITLPGLIDPHVHLRTPGQTHKEDFLTGTMAALAGGFTTIFDMPNNTNLITTFDLLKEKQILAKENTVCDIGFHFGSLGDNLAEFEKIQNNVFGLKVYLNQTTGGFVINLDLFEKICAVWPKTLPILTHAEDDILEQVLIIGIKYKQKIHVCHVSSASELSKIIEAKKTYEFLTCGVTPHHLFLTSESAEKIGAFGKMKPALKTQEDVNYLWSHIQNIDLIESDHAPHTKEEKLGDNPPFGVPGLETSLPLLINAVNGGRIKIEDVKRLCHDKAASIFNIPEDKTTYIEIDENETWTINNNMLFTKCKWTPFAGWEVKGKLKRVVLRGKTVFENGKILSEQGTGSILKSVV